MRASGDQLRQLTTLLDAGTIRPVVDRAFDFASTREALAHVEQPGTIGCPGRATPRPSPPFTR
jgi:NADPH:quinone reductase-like Zn-dependent oxidoreductase